MLSNDIKDVIFNKNLVKINGDTPGNSFSLADPDL